MEAKPAEEAPAPKPAPAEGIDHAAANAALSSAAAAARSCRSYGPPPSPHGRAAVAFGSDGSVTAVSISQNFMGTPVGNCVRVIFVKRAPPRIAVSQRRYFTHLTCQNSCNPLNPSGKPISCSGRLKTRPRRASLLRFDTRPRGFVVLLDHATKYCVPGRVGTHV